MYLLTIDVFSSYVFFTKFRGSPTSETVIATLNKLFLQVGFPRKIRSDGAGHFDSRAFSDWCRRCHIENVLSSAHHHESEGLIERNVRSVKLILKKSKEDKNTNFEESLSTWQNVPRNGFGMSPAHLFHARDLRLPDLPHLPDSLQGEEGIVANQILKEKEKKKRNVSISIIAPPPLELFEGQRVLLQNPDTKLWDRKG